MSNTTAEEVLDFWFNELSPADWWKKSDDFDALIKRRFLTVQQSAVQGECFSWRESAQGRLAEIIVLDQFSRNIFRDTPQAFASDTMALVLAQEAIASAADIKLTSVEKPFLYMPFMHSESLIIHEVAVALFTDNGVQANVDFELKHKVIIERFGRYPHRNIILGRVSTEEEVSFLQGPNSSF